MTDQFPDWIGGIDLESCGQTQQPISITAGLCGDGGAGPLHLWPDAQRAEAARPEPVQVGAAKLMFLSLARSLSSGNVSMFQGCCRCSRWCSVLETRNSGAENFGWVCIWSPQQLGCSTSLCLRQHYWWRFTCWISMLVFKKINPDPEKTYLFSFSWIGLPSAGLFAPSSLLSYRQELHPTHTTRKPSCKSLPLLCSLVSWWKQRLEVMFSSMVCLFYFVVAMIYLFFFFSFFPSINWRHLDLRGLQGWQRNREALWERSRRLRWWEPGLVYVVKLLDQVLFLCTQVRCSLNVKHNQGTEESRHSWL